MRIFGGDVPPGYFACGGRVPPVPPAFDAHESDVIRTKPKIYSWEELFLNPCLLLGRQTSVGCWL